VQAVIEVRNLKKEYVSGIAKKSVTKALDGVDLSIPKGTVFGLTGESGCGKTTLAMLIMRLIDPTSGSVIIDGIDITRLNGAEMRKLRPACQIIWQNPDASLNPRMKLKDNILEPLRYYKKCKNGDERDILDRYCRMAELPENLLNRYPHEVSGGENQRAVIARMLTLQPKLLVADEPTSSLDILVQAQILQLLKRIQQQLRITMLFISHDLQAIAYMCDQVAVMRSGQIIEKGACRQLFSAPRTPYCRELVKNAFTPWRFAS
jgi:ABC-type glutathione transport system ATPase component